MPSFDSDVSSKFKRRDSDIQATIEIVFMASIDQSLHTRAAERSWSTFICSRTWSRRSGDVTTDIVAVVCIGRLVGRMRDSLGMLMPIAVNALGIK